MNRLRAYAQSWSAMLLAGWVAGLGGLLVSFLLFVDRRLFEPILVALLPYVTKALFRSAFFYEPNDYFWIAGYVGGFAALWTLAMVYVVLRAPAENRGVDAALLKRMGGQETRGAPLEP